MRLRRTPIRTHCPIPIPNQSMTVSAALAVQQHGWRFARRVRGMNQPKPARRLTAIKADGQRSARVCPGWQDGPSFNQARTPTVFPEYRELITRLKTENPRFVSLFDKHNALDQKIINMEKGIELADHGEIERLKREKLALKDDLYAILKQASA